MTVPPLHRPWAFHALLSLDQNGKARQELAQAGVAQHRIDALYPVAFADLVPGLKQHLSDLGGEHIYLLGDLPKLNSLFDANKKLFWAGQHYRHQRDLEAETVLSLGDLRDYLLQTWEEAHGEQRPRLAILHPMWLWSAWWSMSTFEELTDASQQSAAELLVAVDEAWQFPRKKSDV